MTSDNAVPILAADHDGADAAVAALRAGGCVAVPTDTVYGVAAALSSPNAVRRLFELKGRAATKAMAVLVGSAEQAYALGQFSDHARTLVERHWPGPLTVVVRRVETLRTDLGGDASTIGLRCPDSSLIAAITAEVGPIVTTSANLSGEATIVDAASIAATFPQHLDVVLDGGALDGSASTVVDLCGPAVDILREGPISVSDLLGP